jgi:hypothetical protein
MIIYLISELPCGGLGGDGACPELLVFCFCSLELSLASLVVGFLICG